MLILLENIIFSSCLFKSCTLGWSPLILFCTLFSFCLGVIPGGAQGSMLKDCHSGQAWGPMCEPWLATVKAKDPNLLCSHSSLLEQHYFIPWCTSFSKSLLSLVIEKIVKFGGQCIACSLLRTLFPLLQSNTWVHLFNGQVSLCLRLSQHHLWNSFPNSVTIVVALSFLLLDWSVLLHVIPVF